MPSYLNQGLGFDEVRWATMRRISYDSRQSFQSPPRKVLLPQRTRLYRLVHFANGNYFDGVWWMPKDVFDALRADANQAQHGGGRLFRNYVAQYMALPNGNSQLSVIEIELTQKVYAWVGQSASLFGRPGGMEQVFLPYLGDRGRPSTSSNARLVHTYWLRF